MLYIFNRLGQIKMICAVMFLVSCSAITRYHGYLPKADRVDQLKIGVATPDTVREALGSPTGTLLSDENAWYYVKSEINHFLFYAPEIGQRDILIVSFGEDALLSNIDRLSLADGRVVALTSRVTRSPIQGTSFIQQIIGNLGNIDGSDFIR